MDYDIMDFRNTNSTCSQTLSLPQSYTWMINKTVTYQARYSLSAIEGEQGKFVRDKMLFMIL